VCGLSARFPMPRGESVEAATSGAPSSALPGAGSFWRTQLAGSDLTATVPHERWDVDTTYDPFGGIAKACAHPAEIVLCDSLHAFHLC